MWMIIQRKKTADFYKDQDCYFSDTLEGFFTKTVNGEKVTLHHWSGDFFGRDKVVSLYDILQDNIIQEQLPDAKNVQFLAGKSNTLMIKVGGAVRGSRRAVAIPKNEWLTLNSQNSISLYFDENGFEIEFHVRKKENSRS